MVFLLRVFAFAVVRFFLFLPVAVFLAMVFLPETLEDLDALEDLLDLEAVAEVIFLLAVEAAGLFFFEAVFFFVFAAFP
ncbi:MAG: hypothetical protein K2J63_06990, partial [Muribaculaceae bacterium]|nr:hypothetical protein [Muribaculaceae bacterium]